MKVTQYRTFDLISLKDGIELDDFGNKLEKWVRFANKSDTIIATNLLNFIEQLRHIPMKKVEYLNYWDRIEHQKKNIIDSYEDIISCMFDIEKQANLISQEFGHDVFILRVSDPTKINYLRESDLDIEFEKVRNVIYKRINESVSVCNDKLSLRLDDLLKRTEIVFSRIAEYSYHRSMNPNLKIQNKTGYSLSDV